MAPELLHRNGGTDSSRFENCIEEFSVTNLAFYIEHRGEVPQVSNKWMPRVLPETSKMPQFTTYALLLLFCLEDNVSALVPKWLTKS